MRLIKEGVKYFTLTKEEKLNDTYGKILELGVRYYTNIGYFEYSKNL